MCCYCGFEMTSQLLPLTLSERMLHRPSNDAIWDLRHDLRRNLTESRWFSFVNTTWLDSSETRSGSKSSLESSLKSRLLVNTAPGPWVLLQYRYTMRLLIIRSRNVSKPHDFYLEYFCKIALKFDRNFSSSAADVPGKFQSDAMI